MPSRSLLAASWKARLTSATLAGRVSRQVRSVLEPFSTGTRRATPCSLPANSGSTSPIALAAPVLVGMMLTPAARARRLTLLAQPDPPAVHDQRALEGTDVPIERPERRVVLEQMGQGRVVPQVVDRDDLDALVEQSPVEQAAQVVAADTAEAVDRH